MNEDKRANCEALKLVINAAEGYVRHVESLLKLHGQKYEKDQELDTAIFMMQQYVDQNKLI